MAEWLVEEGIGERRAALVEGGALLEMALEWDDDPRPRAGAVLEARFLARADATGRGRIAFKDGTVAHLAPVPAGLAEGAHLMVEIVRETLPEGNATKPARARPAPADAIPSAGPDLLARLRDGVIPVRLLSRGESLEAHGWSEAIEEAETGVIARPHVMLRISPTPAMTLIDVDGMRTAAELAVAGAREAGLAIRRFGIAGSIGIDLPTLASKAERQAAAAALDAVLPPPFERTGVNGFGFLQIVRRRERRSVIERLRADPVGAAARALLAQAGRAGGIGAMTVAAHPRVIDRIAAGPGWTEALAGAMGAPVVLRAEPALAISAGHVARQNP